MTRLALVFVAMAALGGCLGSAPPVPRDHFYRIQATAPPGAAERHLPGVLSVRPLEADGLLRERPLVFGATARPHKMQQHDYHYWTDPPPRMLQGQLVDYLRQSGVARAVVTPDLRIPPDFEVLGRIKRLSDAAEAVSYFLHGSLHSVPKGIARVSNLHHLRATYAATSLNDYSL